MGLRTLGLLLVAVGAVPVCIACSSTNAGSTTGTTGTDAGPSTTDDDGGSTAVVAPTAIACPDCLTAAQLNAFCTDYVVTCMQSITMAQCLSYYDLVRVSASCKAMLPSASCSDLETAGSPLLTACFPSCTALSTNVCSADGTYVTACDENGNTEVVDCARLCASDDATWDTTTKCGGTCVNTTGQPACCCSK